MPPTDPRYVEVYRSRNLGQAHVLRGMLEAEGIPAIIENDLLQGAAGELPVGWATSPRIMVEVEHGLRARAIADEFDAAQVDRGQGKADDVSRCLACGAPMPEEQEDCKKCGWSYTAEGEESCSPRE